jgi:hypothetical protein
MEVKTYTLYKWFIHHSFYIWSNYMLFNCFFSKLFEFYLEFLKNIMLLFVVLSLLNCRIHPFFPPIFSDDTVDRSLFFMDGIDPNPTLKSNRSIKTGLTFVLCICFFWNSWKYDVITKNYYIRIMKYSDVLFLGKCVHVLNYRNIL